MALGRGGAADVETDRSPKLHRQFDKYPGFSLLSCFFLKKVLFLDHGLFTSFHKDRLCGEYEIDQFETFAVFQWH